MNRWLVALSFSLMAVTTGGGVCAQETPAVGHAVVSDASADKPAVDTPAGFVIGPDDVPSIVFWRDKEMSTQVTVRPDGKITLPLLDEVQAAGLTPAALRAQLIDASKRFFGNPNITVIVKEIHSRKVFITGQVCQARPLHDHDRDDGASAHFDGRRAEGFCRQQQHPRSSAARATGHRAMRSITRKSARTFTRTSS